MLTWSVIKQRSHARLLASALGMALPPLFLLFYPWPMAGVEIPLAFGAMALLSGVLLRTGWAGLIVPAMVVVAVVAHSLIVHGVVDLAGDEFTTGGALVVASMLLFFLALTASLGALIGRRVW